jgi:hypothetical protein
MALCAPCAVQYKELYEHVILCSSPECIPKVAKEDTVPLAENGTTEGEEEPSDRRHENG